MEERDPTIRALREALAHSPENVPLRRHLAESLAGLARFEEAAAEYRALLRDHDDDGPRVALARTYLDGGQPGHAAVLLELLVQRDPPLAEAHLLMARVHLAEGELERAARAYRRAVEHDATLADGALARRLGLAGSEPADEEPRRVPVAGDPEDVHPDASEPGEGVLGDVDLERPDLTFADVGGMDEVKEEISIKVVQPLAHPELFQAYGKKVGGGLLLYGPPGCGKTYLARATAGEVDARFLAVGIHQILDMWIGSSEKNMGGVFALARRSAPCVLFFDEVDALAAKRADMRGAAGRQVINMFLSELDGVKDSNEGVLVLAATNAPWHIDPAFRRPGRFDRVLFVPPPDRAAREAILRVHLARKPLGPDVDPAKLAGKTDGFSGADLMGVVELAVESRLREAMKRGGPAPLGQKDLLAAIKRTRPSTREWFATAKNHVLFANEGGIYDELKEYMGL